MKKHNNSAKKNEQPSKRAKSQGPVQRDTKEVLAELVGKLKEKLDPKVVAASAGEEHRRGGLRPNLDRLTWARSAIYRDSSDNIIRLLKIRGDYCVYAYVTLGIPRSELHGSVTGLTRRDVFEAGFIFVAECVQDWNRKRRKSSDRRAQALHIHPPWAQSTSRRLVRPNSTIDPRSVSQCPNLKERS